MGNNKKTAKDLAFDRERAKYGRRIKELETVILQINKENTELREKVRQAESERDQLQDWVDRLLEYTEVSKEDMEQIIQKDKDSAAAMSMIKSLMKVSSFGSYFM